MIELVHYALNFVRTDLVVRIASLADLEEHIRVLGGAAQHGMIRREPPLPMLEDALHVDQGTHVVFGEHLDFVDFM